MKLEVGKAVSRTARLYFRLFGVLFIAALVVNTALSVLFGAIVVDSVTDLRSLFTGVIIVGVASIMAASLIQALSTHAVGDMEDGERSLTIGQLFGLAGPVVGAVIGVSLLQGIAVAVGFVLLLVPGVFALTWWAVAVPAVVVERPGVFAAFGRSVELVRGNAWNVFGYGLVMILIMMAGGFVVDLVLLGILDLDSFVGVAIGDIVADSVMTPFGAVGYAVLYFQLRRVESQPPLDSGP